MLYPQNYTLVSGWGNDEFELVSFDKSLFCAGISDYNLVKVSSILPSNCAYLPKVTAKPGSIVFAAFAAKSSNVRGKISSAIGVGIPKNPLDIGVIMEFSSEKGKAKSEKTVTEMVTRSMVLRNIEVGEIKTSAVETNVTGNGFSTVFSALVMW